MIRQMQIIVKTEIKMNIRKFALVMCLLHGGLGTMAQQIRIDQGVMANGMMCFPTLEDSLEYKYLPNDAVLALDGQGKPQFSLVRYVENEANATSENTSITKADGGAVLHFMVVYETSDWKIEKTETALKKKLNNNSLRLSGPVVFSEGSYALVSSILNARNSSVDRSILAIGQAPVFEGSRVALSFQLNPGQSRLLLESFKMATPDISLVFDMSFTGLTDAFNAEMTVDWSEVSKSQSYRAGGSVYYVSADVKLQIEELIRNNAIRLTTVGQDVNMEALITKVYDRVLSLLYEPVKPGKVEKDGGLSQAIDLLLDPEKGMFSSRNTTGFGLYGGFQYKNIRSEGKTVMNFNSRTNSTRHHFITFNIGDLYKKHGDNTSHFKTISMDDPDFNQREIQVGIDGELAREFDQMVNSATVSLLKVHQSGDSTLREMVIKRSALDTNGPLRLVYGSKNDHDKPTWLKYQYKTYWQFQGGYGDYETAWHDQTSAMINLYVPYERKGIQLIGDMKKLEAAGVKAVVVQVQYLFFDEKRKLQKVIRAGEKLEDEPFRVVMPLNQFEYDYSITWVKNNGEQISREGTDSFGLLFIDELPGTQTNNNQ